MKFICYVFFSVLMFWLLSCGFSHKRKKREFAQKQADSIMANFDDPEMSKVFADQYFDRNQTESILGDIREKCDWQHRDGKFVDYFIVKNIGGNDQIMYIYEYYLKCDSLRFLLIYDMGDEKTNPQMTAFKMEKLETPCPYIIDPKKQLKNR